MGLAFLSFLLSVVSGIFLSFFNVGFGAVAAISITGAFIVYSLNRKDPKNQPFLCYIEP